MDSNTIDISPDYNFFPNFIEVHDSKMHYVDEGEGNPILFLHGNPTSSYLWRNVIPHLTGVGRCIAPDLIGMGKSDKPDISYRFEDHYKYLSGFIEQLGLKNITLVIHDWGSALGFHYANLNRENVKAIAFMEAVILPAKWSEFPKSYRLPFKMMRAPFVGWVMISVMNSFIEKVLPGSVSRKLTEVEMDHYREPYKTINSRKPLRQWPSEIPIDGTPADNHQYVQDFNQYLQATEMPKLLIYAKPGAILRKAQVKWCEENLKNLTTAFMGTGLHFIQEDNPDFIGKEILKWYKTIA